MFSDPANYYGKIEENNDFEQSDNGGWYTPPKRKPKYQVKIPKSFYIVIGLIFLCFPFWFVIMSFEHLMENKEKSYMEAQRRKKIRRKNFNGTNFTENDNTSTSDKNTTIHTKGIGRMNTINQNALPIINEEDLPKESLSSKKIWGGRDANRDKLWPGKNNKPWIPKWKQNEKSKVAYNKQDDTKFKWWQNNPKKNSNFIDNNVNMKQKENTKTDTIVQLTEDESKHNKMNNVNNNTAHEEAGNINVPFTNIKGQEQEDKYKP